MTNENRRHKTKSIHLTYVRKFHEKQPSYIFNKRK